MMEWRNGEIVEGYNGKIYIYIFFLYFNNSFKHYYGNVHIVSGLSSLLGRSFLFFLQGVVHPLAQGAAGAPGVACAPGTLLGVSRIPRRRRLLGSLPLLLPGGVSRHGTWWKASQS